MIDNMFMEFKKKIIIYRTILHCACHSGNFDLVKYIIESDMADINDIDIFI